MPISVLGPVELHDRDGDTVRALSEHQTRLLAALAVHAGTVVSAEALVHMVWDDDELPEGGVKALRTRMTRLRRVLADAGVEVVTVGAGYRLDPEQVEDQRRFEATVEQAREAVEADPAAAAAMLDDALDVWRGPAYGPLAALEWVRAEASRLDGLRVSAIEHRFAALLDRGRHTEIVGPLERAVDAAPYRDRLRAQLVLALYRSGRQAEALEVIARYREQLVEELGLDLTPELQELEAQVLRHDPGLLPASRRARALRDYRLEEVIGEGAFALVWRGSQPGLERAVAVKQIRAQLANQPDFIRRFEIEARLVASLEHPHIVPLYDYWREPDGAYLVMRMLHESLEAHLLTERLAEPALARMVSQVGSALQVAHETGVIHRDIKSANLLMDRDGNFYLSDFGIAFGIEEGDELASAMSTGSPAYASPEQLRRQSLDARSDIYALGITLFEAATGRLPFAGVDTQAAMVRHQLEDRIPLPSTVAPVPRWVDDLVARATAKQPDERFSSVTELLAALPAAPVDSTPGDSAAGATIVTGELRNPFKGLRAFREADVGDFFGRERLVERFLEVLRRPGSAGRLLAAVGPSGSGKSSAVRAGLVPALRRGALPDSDRWFITTMIPGARPFEELESALVRVAAAPPGPLVELMAGDERGIARAVNQVLPEAGSELVLVVDQFEELFTHTHDRGERRRFLDGLVSAVRESRSRVRVVATIRADFWDRPLEHPALAALLESSAVMVSPLAADELEQAIVAPVQRQGVEYEPGLVARLLADVADEPGALPLLQYALTGLFDEQVSGLIRAESYAALGGLAGALATRAEEVHARLGPAEQERARRLFGQLVTLGEGVEDTRRRVTIDELGRDEALAACLDRFGEARLLTFDHDPSTRRPTVEIAHEALLRAWPRLRQWVDEDRDRLRIERQLTAAAAEWDRGGRDDDELYRGARLETALELLRQLGDELGPPTDDFVAASDARAHADAERRRRRTRVLQGLLATTAVLLVFALIAGVVAVNQRDDARDARLGAEAAGYAAETERIAAEAVLRAETDPRLGLLLAAEAHRRAPGPQTLGTLQRTMLRSGPNLGFVGRHDARYRDARWIDADTLAVAHLEGVEVYSLTTGELLASFEVPVSEFVGGRAVAAGGDVAFDVSLDGRWAAVATTGSAVELIDLVDGSGRSLPHDRSVTSLTFSPDSSHLATGTADGVVRSWSLVTFEVDLMIDAHPEDVFELEEEEIAAGGLGFDLLRDFPSFVDVLDRGVVAMAYSPDGAVLTTAEYPVVRRWDAESGELVGELFPLTDQTRYAVAPAESTTDILAIGHPPGRPDILELTSRNLVARFQLPGGERLDQTFASDRLDTNDSTAGADILESGAVVIGVSDGQVRLFDPAGVAVTSIPHRLTSPAATVADPGGRRVAVAGDGGVGIFALDGQELLADAITWHPGAVLLTISGDGDLVAQSGYTTGPTHGHRLQGGGFADTAVPDAVVPLSAELVTGADGTAYFAGYDNTATSDGPDGTSALFDVETGELVLPFSGFFSGLAFDFSRDARWHANPEGRQVGVWDLATGAQEVVLGPLVEREPFAGIRSITFSADSSRLLATAADGVVGGWFTATWEPIALPDLGLVTVARFSPDGRFVATADLDGVVTIRDAETYESVSTLVGAGPPQQTQGWMRWTDDGRHLLTHFETTPRLWDVETGVQIGDPFPHTPDVNYGAAGVDPIQLVTLVDEVVRVWDLDVDSWPDLACAAAGRNLTQAEWSAFGPRGEPYEVTCPQYPPGP